MAKTIRRRKKTKKTVRKTVAPVDFTAKGYHSITPYIMVHDGKAAVDFYIRAFGAKEKKGRLSDASGKIMHTEIRIGDSYVMLADEFPQWNNPSPKSVGKATVQFNLYVKNCDAVIQKAVAAGATLVAPVQDQFYGDRSGRIEDPFGYQWHISTHVENVGPKEMKKRAAKLYGAV